MALNRFYGIFVSISLFWGCMVENPHEPAPPRNPAAGMNPRDTGEDSIPSQCHLRDGTGCLDVFMSSRRALTVAGQNFFNVEDFLARFGEVLVTAGTLAESSSKAQGKVVTFPYAIDRNAFLNGFEFELTGRTKKSGKVPTGGVLRLNDLAPGAYELRLLRSIPFKLEPQPGIPKHASKQGVDEPIPDGLEVESRCALLYSDTSVEIEAGQRFWESISDFQIQILDKTCGFLG